MANKTIPAILTNEGNVGIGISRTASLNTTTAVNGTGGGNREFVTFTGASSTGFTGTDNADQGYGYFAVTIVSGKSYEVSATMVVTNGATLDWVTSTVLSSPTVPVQIIQLVPVSNTTYRFAAIGNATFVGVGFSRTSGTMTAVVSNFSIKEVGSTLVTSESNVGIGLTNPEATSRLHIKNLAAASKVTIESANNSESLINFSAQSSEYSIGFVRDGSNVNSFRFCAADSLSAGEVMRLQDGNVGIGTTVPTYRLDIEGASATSVVQNVRNPSTSWTQYALTRYQTDTKDTRYVDVGYFRGAGAEATRGFVISGLNSNILTLLDIVGGYNLGLGGVTAPLFNIDVASTQGKGIQLRYDTSTGYRAQITPYWNSTSDSRIDFAINRAENVAADVIMSVGYNGNVGIGTTQPSYKLDVAGAIGMHDEGQDIDSRFYGATFLRGWQSFSNGTEANITYTTDGTSPVGVEVLSVSSQVWARGPKIRLDITQNYEVELWVRRQTANTAGTFYFVVSNYDNSGNVIGGDGTDWHYPISVNPLSATWTKYRFIVGPYGGTKDHSPNARYISVGFIANYSTGTDVIYMTGFKCRPIPRYNNDNLTLFNDGRVGIGTTQPTGVLHLYGNTSSWLTSPTIVMASSSVADANVRNWRIGPADTAYGNFHIGVSNVRGGVVDSDAEAQAFTITYDQKVGIGTTSPTAKLVVMGDDVGNYAKSSVPTAIIADDDVEFLIGSTDNFAGEEITLRLGTVHSSYYTYGAYVKAIQGAGVDYYKLAFGTSNGAAATTKMTIANDGKVGIGTVTPLSLLAVGPAGSTSAASGITFGGDAEVNLYRVAENVLQTDAALNVVRSIYSASYFYTAVGQIYGSTYGNLTFFVGNSAGNAWQEGMFIKRGSYVGIGTTNPTGKLHVVSSVAGETVLRTDGTNGTLFSVVDDLSDSLMSVNNSAGLPVLEVFADDRVVAGQYGSGDFVLINNKVGLGTSNPTNKLSVIGGASIGSSTYNVAAPSDGLIVEGRVGIGSTSPNYKLEVYSPALDVGRFYNNQTSCQLNIGSTNNTEYTNLIWYTSNGNTQFFKNRSSASWGGTDSMNLYNSNGGFAFHPNGIANSVNITTAGNVGVNQAAPTTKLDVVGSFRVVGTTNVGGIFVTGSSANQGNIRPAVSNGSVLISDDSGLSARGLTVSNGGGAIISSSDANYDILTLQIGGTTNHNFNRNGNVGIGATNPNSARLHIKGDGTAPIIRVETAKLESAAGGTAGRTLKGWLPIMTGSNASTDTVYIPLFGPYSAP